MLWFVERWEIFGPWYFGLWLWLVLTLLQFEYRERNFPNFFCIEYLHILHSKSTTSWFLSQLLDMRVLTMCPNKWLFRSIVKRYFADVMWRRIQSYNVANSHSNYNVSTMGLKSFSCRTSFFYTIEMSRYISICKIPNVWKNSNATSDWLWSHFAPS